MPTTTYFRSSDGALVDEHEATDQGCLRSGYLSRTKLSLMDRDALEASEPLTDEQRIATIDAYNEAVSNRWRGPAANSPSPQPPRMADGSVDMSTVYAEYERRLSDAWRA
jgi:hypothetical protein